MIPRNGLMSEELIYPDEVYMPEIWIWKQDSTLDHTIMNLNEPSLRNLELAVLKQLGKEIQADLLWHHGIEAYQCDDSTYLEFMIARKQAAQRQISPEQKGYQDLLWDRRAQMIKDPVALQKGWLIYIPRTFEIVEVSNLAKDISRFQHAEKEFGALVLMNVEADFVMSFYFR